MATAIGALFVDLSVNSAAFSADLGKANRALNSNASKMNRTLGNLTRHFNLSASSVAGLGATAVLVAGGALLAFTKRAVTTADAIAKSADKIGIGIEAYQELGFASEIAGVKQRVFEMGLQRFSRRVGEAVQNKGELRDTLKAYGVDVIDAEGNTRKLEDVLGDYADAVKNAKSTQEQLRLSFKAFDSEGAVMVNLMRRGSEGINEMRAEAQRLGVVIDADMARNAERANDELTRLSRVVSVNMTSSLLHLAPTLETVAGLLVDMSKGIGIVARAFAGPAQDSIASLEKQIEGTKEQISEFIAAGRDKGGSSSFLTILRNDLIDMEKRLVKVKAIRDAFGNATGGIVSTKSFEDVLGVLDKRANALGEEQARLRTTAAEWERYQAVQEAVAFAQKNNIFLSTEHIEILAEQSEAVLRQAQALEKAEQQHKELEDEIKRTEQAYKSMGTAATGFLKDLTTGAESASDAVKRLAEDLLKAFLQAKLFGPLETFFTSLGTSAATAGVSPTPGATAGTPFARGGQFEVTGRGGTDANFVPLSLTKGERVTVETAAQQRMSDGGKTIFNIDMRGASVEAVARLEQLLQGLNASIESRALAVMFEAGRRGAAGA